MFYEYSSHYSLLFLCIFTSPGRMCKHSLHSLIVKIPFPITIKTSPSDVISITDSPATMRMNFRMIADCYHGNTCRECNSRESTANGRGSRVTFIFCSVSMDGGILYGDSSTRLRHLCRRPMSCYRYRPIPEGRRG